MEYINKYGFHALLAAMAGDIIVSLLLPLFYGGYSSMKMSISALGNPQSPVRLPFNLWMLAEGLLFLVALPALHKHYAVVSGGLTNTLVAFVAVFAVGACIFTCFFSSLAFLTLASYIACILFGDFGMLRYIDGG